MSITRNHSNQDIPEHLKGFYLVPNHEKTKYNKALLKSNTTDLIWKIGVIS